jgi:hypothetical protein
VESLTAIIHNSLAHTIANPLSNSASVTLPTPEGDTQQTELRQPETENPQQTATEPNQDNEQRTETIQETQATIQSETKETQNDTDKPLTAQDQPSDSKYPPQSLDGHTLSTQELHVDAMQVKMLEALTDLSEINHNDVKEKTLNAVDTLLQSSGQTLNSG